MARPALPLEMIEANRDCLRPSKKQLDARKKLQEQRKIGDTLLLIPDPMVEIDQYAMQQWLFYVNLYSQAGCTFITSADSGLLSRYCLCQSEYRDLQTRRTKIAIDSGTTRKKPDDYDLFKTEMLLKLDAAINKKNSILATMAGQLFLDPRSRATISKMAINNLMKKSQSKEKQKRTDDDLFQ